MKSIYISILLTCLAAVGAAHAALDPNDYRIRQMMPTFPIIFHYRNGEATSSFSPTQDILPKSYDALPQAVKCILSDENIAKGDVEVYQATCMYLEDPTINYFTHCWAMDEMLDKTVDVTVKSGLFDAQNLESIANEMGLNALIPQLMSYHDRDCLSNNVAKFKVSDPSKESSAWIVSVNESKKKAIVCYWKFPPVGQ